MFPKKALFLFLLVFVFFFNLTNEAFATTDRLNGSTRYETAVEISKAFWDRADAVVLARGSDFPDALAGGPLAFYYDAPILLTHENRLTTVTKNEIARLKVTEVVILGSTGAISKAVEDEIKRMGVTVTRIGGKTRYETAALIAQKIPSTKAVIANGRDFPDALTIAPYASKNNIPILLTEASRVPSATKEALKGKSSTIVVGGNGVINRSLYSQFPNPTAYAGQNRYDTGKVITNSLPMDSNHVYIATGENFADALAGSVLAAKKEASILLVRNNSIPSATKSLLSSYEGATILGGQGAVSKEVENGIRGNLSIKDIKPSPEIQPKPQPTPEPKPVPEPEPDRTINADSDFSARGVSLGDTKDAVISSLGQPSRIDNSAYGFKWYIYNNHYARYLQIGIHNNKVVALQSNADVWESVYGIKIGTSKKTVTDLFEQTSSPYYPSQELVMKEFNGKQSVTIFFDKHNQNRVSAIQIIHSDFEIYGPFVSNPSPELATQFERQFFDYVNVSRLQHGLQPFQWDDKASLAARNHSIDMVEKDYFAHRGLDGRQFYDRMSDVGISYSTAGENLAAGGTNSLFAHQMLMNSAGHRGNILALYERLGTGVAFGGTYGIYYTQKFYSPR